MSDEVAGRAAGRSSGGLPRTGIVLSGGGARGAYEVGVVMAIVEALERRGHRGPPFQILCGTSVGAINATYLASRAHEARMDVEGLAAAWESLRLEEQLRLDVRGLLDMPRAMLRGSTRLAGAPSVLDTRSLEAMVESTVAFHQIHSNLQSGKIDAVVVPALEIGTGRTTLFIGTSPTTNFIPSRDPRQITVETRLEVAHVMASAALPLLFPPRRVGAEHYCDGGVRFNTPIAPAIRAGADRLVVVALQYEQAAPVDVAHRSALQGAYGNPAFLIGKVLDALLLDPTRYDLHVLERINDLIEQMERVLTPEQLERFHGAVGAGRGTRYRRLETLVFRPSEDIGQIAHRHRAHLSGRGLSARLLLRFATRGSTYENDFLSFMLFDGGFARRLIELGRRDAQRREDEVLRFYQA